MKRIFYLFIYEFKYALHGIRKHLVLTLSCVSAMMVSIFLIGCFLLMGLHVDHFATNVQHDMTIHVILEADIEQEEQIQGVQDKIKELDNVESVQFSSKDDELELMIQEKGEAFQQYRGEENPLSNAFFVEVNDSDQIEDTSKNIEKIEGVASVAYGGSSVTQLIDLMDVARKGGYVLAGLLLILSLYMIYNTIKTTIYSREEEISIMRQVGASNAFIRIPFVIQGVLIGLFGALIPFLILYFGYPWLYEKMGGILFTNVFSLLNSHTVNWIVGSTMLGCGSLIGMLASLLAVGKTLRSSR